MPLLMPLLPLIAQVGPFTAPGTNGTPFPERVERPAKPRYVSPAPVLPPVRAGKAQACLDSAENDAEEAVETATDWLSVAKPDQVAEANLCLGMAQSRLEDWGSAETAFLAGRDAAGSDRLMRARLGAMAGNAALAGGRPDRAVAALNPAQEEAKGLADPALTATIAMDRARALVALKRESEAEAPLAEARETAPDNAEAWLLSATLSRREGKLAEAQQRIERAAELLPVDPDVGLEAGVIAVLAGHDEAARKSWNSVVQAAPDSPAAATAKGYLAQLGPAPISKPATTSTEPGR